MFVWVGVGLRVLVGACICVYVHRHAMTSHPVSCTRTPPPTPTPTPLTNTPSTTQPVQPPAERALQEQPWTLTQADGLQVAASVGLGVMNFVGVVALTQLLQDPTARFALANSGLAFMGGLLPYLAVGVGVIAVCIIYCVCMCVGGFGDIL